MRKAITSIYLIVNKQEFPSRHKLLPDFYCHFPIVVVVTISIIFLLLQLLLLEAEQLIHSFSGFKQHTCSFFFLLLYILTTICASVPVLLFFTLPHFISFCKQFFLFFIRLPLLLASVFIFVNGVVMICDGVKNKFPWTTILFSICAFFFCSLLHPPYLAALSEIQFSTRMIAYRACDKHMCVGVENIQC